MMEKDFRPDDPKWKNFIGPAQVDQLVRNALQMCWMMMPSDKRTPQEVEAAFRKIVDRAIKDFRDDSETFRKT